ncbi:hydroxyisourate hydrolase [uncultured Nocardioides sp.]|uniref:hydroxyisourate hydrolase n=1 Tax=uncultured Nocardioides sp. TaxID=198441 RepID=UPI0026230BB7|nr:hydroxyisourate hydrolase [uncultured Nocardioides sp.]
MTTCSTHVLDSTHGRPASGVEVVLTDVAGQTHRACTDGDGRFRFDIELTTGRHQLVFETGPWFADLGQECFHPEVVVPFTVQPDEPHVHVALLLSPFAYTTYRGS